MGCGASGSGHGVIPFGKEEVVLTLAEIPLKGGQTQGTAPDGQVLEFFVPAGYPPNTQVKALVDKKPPKKSGASGAKAEVKPSPAAGAAAKASTGPTSVVTSAGASLVATEDGSAPTPPPPLSVEVKIVHPVQKGVVELPPQLPRMEGSWDWLRKDNDQLHRVTRVDASERLREAFKKGSYCIASQGKASSSVIKFSCIRKMITGTKMLSIGQGLPKLPKDPKHSLVLEHGQGITPIEKAETMALGGYKPATVSAASAYKAGGGFTTGGRHALEEAFCSQSTLYPSLEKALDLWKAGVSKRLWKNDAAGYSQHIPTDGCILSPHVEIFRGNTDQGYFVKNRTVPITAVISVAMYNKNPNVRDSPCDAPRQSDEYERGVRSKFTAMIHAAALSGADAIIIPDVGCGVFQNDPSVCGRICGEALFNYCSRFRRTVFTGNKSFFEAAQAAISKASAGGVMPITADLDQRGSMMPVDSQAHLYIGRCSVCGRGLAGIDFNSLAVLLDSGQKSTQMQFLHDNCLHGAKAKFPKQTVMRLPDITRNAKSFFKALDLNGNGYIEKAELRCVCALLWEGDLVADPSAFERDFDKRFDAWDIDQTGHVDRREVEAAVTPQPSPNGGALAKGAAKGDDKKDAARPATPQPQIGRAHV